MSEFDSEVHECPICKEKFLDIEGKYYMCPDCEKDFADFDAIEKTCKTIGVQTSDFQLNQFYEVFFKTREEMEAALEYYVRNVMEKKTVEERCIDFCRQDPHWYYDWVVKEIKKRRSENDG
jgi:hypothetical protein